MFKSKLSLVVLLFIVSISMISGCKEKSTEPGLGTVATPVFDPPGGAYTSFQTVSISCATLGVTILYTTDGTEPHSGSSVYQNPLSITNDTTIKAKAFRDGWKDSNTATANYTLNLDIEMILIPGGTFTMGDTRGEGSNNELPIHSVTLNSFLMSKYEAKQGEYAQYMQPVSSWTSESGLGYNYPAYYVSWYDVLKYSNLRSMAEGLTPVYSISGSTDPANWGEVSTDWWDATWDAAICDWSANGYRLPTEAEWEYAARGATNTPDYLYSGSDNINAVAWYDGNNSPHGSKPVGTLAPNGLGLHDMSGNVFEWCWDWYSSYSSDPQNNPTGPASGHYRVLRGGGWVNSAALCRVADRFFAFEPGRSEDGLGFRLCRSVP